MVHYFTLDNSPIYQNKYVLRFNLEGCPFPNGTEGSYAVFPARLMNLSYTDYLRFTRDRLGAELIGKFNKYVTPYFDKTEEVLEFVKSLNLRMKTIMFEQEHPYELIKKEDGTILKVSYTGEILDERKPIDRTEQSGTAGESDADGTSTEGGDDSDSSVS